MPDSVCMQVWRISREPEKSSRGAQHASKVVIKYSHSSYTYDLVLLFALGSVSIIQ